MLVQQNRHTHLEKENILLNKLQQKLDTNMIYSSLIFLEQQVRETIDSKLGRTGLLYRLYSRIKDKESISEKIDRKGYKANGKLLQDIIGVRVMTYFTEDIEILAEHFSSIFKVSSYEHDTPEINEFSAVRLNLVCQMEGNLLKEFEVWKNKYPESFKYIDSTFEIQIRTTLSDGWHEIDHTMRYKCKEEWESLSTESRLLNGIHATLEISDKAMFQLFEEIAYQHYKSNNWMGMLRNKYRLRFEMKTLSTELSELLDNDHDLARQIYKTNRGEIIYRLINSCLHLPITFDNIIYLTNHISIGDDRILDLTPPDILEEFNQKINQ